MQKLALTKKMKIARASKHHVSCLSTLNDEAIDVFNCGGIVLPREFGEI
jgi:hypothetical protein